MVDSANGSLTIKTSDGSSKIILFSDSTKISKTSDAQLSELTTGQTIAAQGTSNSDGSITAQSIQLNPTIKFQNSLPKSNSSGSNSTKSDSTQTPTTIPDNGTQMPPMDDTGGPPMP